MVGFCGCLVQRVGKFQAEGVSEGLRFVVVVDLQVPSEGHMDKICVARDEECGVYGFVFFRDGEWISTVVSTIIFFF